jgi:quercetin dioxygenase-like cupin family protein
MAALVKGPDEGEQYGAAHNRVRFLAESPDQPLAITDVTVPPGFAGPVMHHHAEMFDIFYVLEGTLTLRLEAEERSLGPGGFALIEPGTVHSFANRSEAPVHFLNIYHPSGFEQYLKAMTSRIATGSFPTPEEMRELARSYDFVPVNGD